MQVLIGVHFVIGWLAAWPLTVQLAGACAVILFGSLVDITVTADSYSAYLMQVCACAPSA